MHFGNNVGSAIPLALDAFFVGGIAMAAAQKLRGQSHNECIVSSLVVGAASMGMVMAGVAASHSFGHGLGFALLPAALGGYAGYMAMEPKGK